MASEPYQWATDKSRMGLKLLERMGWSEGKGLGANEDGRVENVTAQRETTESERIAGLGLKTNKENGWDVPGQMASGFNDVLTRLSAVGNVPEPEPKQDDENSADKGGGDDNGDGDGDEGKSRKQHLKRSKNKREARGFYERKRSRKNVGAYSKDQLREIFGGVDAWSSLAAVHQNENNHSQNPSPKKAAAAADSANSDSDEGTGESENQGENGRYNKDERDDDSGEENADQKRPKNVEDEQNCVANDVKIGAREGEDCDEHDVAGKNNAGASDDTDATCVKQESSEEREEKVKRKKEKKEKRKKERKEKGEEKVKKSIDKEERRKKKKKKKESKKAKKDTMQS